VLDAQYFRRIDALNFTMEHDDGQLTHDLDEADVVLIGISRTSKTPTSIYLANRGYKVANIPLVMESPPPKSLYSLKHPLVVGLTTSVDRLVQVRRNRLLSLNQAPETAYVEQETVTHAPTRSHRPDPVDLSGQSLSDSQASGFRLQADPDPDPDQSAETSPAPGPALSCHA